MLQIFLFFIEGWIEIGKMLWKLRWAALVGVTAGLVVGLGSNLVKGTFGVLALIFLLGIMASLMKRP